jgi:hypothetical protein
MFIVFLDNLMIIILIILHCRWSCSLAGSSHEFVVTRWVCEKITQNKGKLMCQNWCLALFRWKNLGNFSNLKKFTEKIRPVGKKSPNLGVDVAITIFCSFRQFSAKELAFFSKTQCYDQNFAYLSLFRVKNAIFSPIFLGENFIKNNNIGPWSPGLTKPFSVWHFPATFTKQTKRMNSWRQ